MSPTPAAVTGALLAALGAGALIWQGISDHQRDTVIKVGSVSVTADSRKTLQVPPIVGVIVLAGGIAFIVAEGRRS